ADRTPLPRPDIRVMNKAIGPVAVFGASNFPLAFSTAGGDTASALAAGCPVVVKAHPAHPGTSEIVAKAIEEAIIECDMPKGVFNLIQGEDFTSGQALVAHPDIKAVGFTGSLRGGRALFDIAVQRPEPIPFYGELGSNNPLFLLPSKMKQDAEEIAKGWVGSLTMGAGQFCTNPGLLVAIEDDNLSSFIGTAKTALEACAPQTMLTAGIADTYNVQKENLAKNSKLECIFSGHIDPQTGDATPALFKCDLETWLTNPDLGEEIFGPAAILITCEKTEDFLNLAASLHGQLTATLFLNDEDSAIAEQLRVILEDKAGRILTNGYPTGVEVCQAMVHGGPYPASTDSRSTSVGAKAIERFVRPVCYQDMPDNLLPTPLQEANPLNLPRYVDGHFINPT
ncbi:MAG: aldehyde dehydrogenase (NADP(+)), partial [Alphaproteobacteria bacterium]|nr:aldehyde dehydrogenase (NADP(+)) [Alphaproteobacteria bacterium]